MFEYHCHSMNSLTGYVIIFIKMIYFKTLIVLLGVGHKPTLTGYSSVSVANVTQMADRLG